MDRLADGVGRRLSNSDLADAIAYRITLETMLRDSVGGKTPAEMFKGISDPFWFWLLTEGYRRSPTVRSLLPSMPDGAVQVHFTGKSGDATLREAFDTYVLLRDAYETYVGPVEECPAILDFGCGWGRVLRFFLKDIEAARLWGADPQEEMIGICRRDLWRCNFEVIETIPPTRFSDGTFGLVYAYSVFSHLSEERHKSCLTELTRVLKPGGLLLVTTRPREFIRLSTSSFADTEQSLRDFDSGAYCFSQLVFEGDRSYWGDTAIPEAYVRREWSHGLEFLDYIDDRRRCRQNVIVMRKPA